MSEPVKIAEDLQEMYAQFMNPHRCGLASDGLTVCNLIERVSAAEAELALAKEENEREILKVIDERDGAEARYKDVQDGSGSYSAGAEGGKVASLRENHPFGSIYDALRKTEAERDKFNASNERLNADHARIVAEKDAEIQRLRKALADAEHLCKWLLQSDITEADKWRAVRDLGINLALALNPPQQVSSACGHQRHDECRFAACVCECHNQPEQKDGE